MELSATKLCVVRTTN